ncbi:hypothetical protein PMZ80_005624 [Knufia obscura]|uniref:Ubiquitin 3 binding protein But2 C-terminal domain-containing protein n=1 Tax=Knufia obscura TaxID=1635080 RepID=A0ABR0RN73_9EURO|nr:hypothetical protein PMZ80_005624 [Knufia obscura]
MKTFTIFAAAVLGVTAMPADLKTQDTSACPYYLPEGSYEFPHLIVPINNSGVAIGHSYFADVSPGDCATIFNFDIPPSRANQQCSVYFTFPRHDQLVTSDYKWNGNNTSTEGPGTLEFVQHAYGTGATDATTGNTQPPLGADALVTVSNAQPGNAYKVWSGSCGGGGVMSWKLSSPDSYLYYFQDWNPCAIGLWVVYETAALAQAPTCGSCPSTKQFASHAAWMEAYTGGALAAGAGVQM